MRLLNFAFALFIYNLALGQDAIQGNLDVLSADISKEISPTEVAIQIQDSILQVDIQGTPTSYSDGLYELPIDQIDSIYCFSQKTQVGEIYLFLKISLLYFRNVGVKIAYGDTTPVSDLGIRLSSSSQCQFAERLKEILTQTGIQKSRTPGYCGDSDELTMGRLKGKKGYSNGNMDVPSRLENGQVLSYELNKAFKNIFTDPEEPRLQEFPVTIVIDESGEIEDVVFFAEEFWKENPVPEDTPPPLIDQMKAMMGYISPDECQRLKEAIYKFKFLPGRCNDKPVRTYQEVWLNKL